jgi:hypothetical protein
MLRDAAAYKKGAYSSEVILTKNSAAGAAATCIDTSRVCRLFPNRLRRLLRLLVERALALQATDNLSANSRRSVAWGVAITTKRLSYPVFVVEACAVDRNVERGQERRCHPGNAAWFVVCPMPGHARVSSPRSNRRVDADVRR